MSSELIIINGPQAGTRYPLGDAEFIIGRAPNSGLVLAEPEVSWRHCGSLRVGRSVRTPLFLTWFTAPANSATTTW